ncbi:TPA: glucosaminidase domain-containing protein, partial [Streptococcus pyogenes]|nr:glucosaminidase domain-containing protein [Streptococcus pyogenes]
MTFLDKIKQGCLDGWTKYKILPSLTAAQAILESGWGKHAPHNALFGIKADASWT